MQRILFLGAVLLSIAGCGTIRPKAETVEVKNTKELLLRSNMLWPKLKTVQLRGSLTAKQGKTNQRITTTLRIASEEFIWINASMIVPLGRAKIDKTGVAFYEQIGETYFEGDFSAIKQALGLTLAYEEIENSLLGIPLYPTALRRARLRKNNEGYVLTARQGNKRLSCTLNAQFFLVSQTLSVGGEQLVIRYGDYKKIAGQWIPMQVRYMGEAKGQAVELSFEFRKAELDNALRVPFNIPKSYTRL